MLKGRPVPRNLHFRSRSATLMRFFAAFLTMTASSLAFAQAVPTIGAGGSDDGAQVPYRGTSVSYGHQLTTYNPTPETFAWSHRIGISPEWHFIPEFYVRGRLFLSQEFTLSDSTNTKHEVELSDLWLDAVWGGYKEPVTGIKLGADLRTTYPTSKPSQAASRVMTVGPSLNLSKSFKVLAGLSLVYSGRFTYRFNRFTTRQNQGGQIVNCAGLGQPEACINTATGMRNVEADLIHGPTVSFSPHERVNFSATFLMQRGWLSQLGAVPTEFAGIPELQQTGPSTRDFMAFSFGATVTPVDIVSFTLGAFTFSNQLDTTGTYMFPLFNRNTVVSLDATFDLEATVSKFTKEKK